MFMANILKHKQSSVAGKVPLTTDLSLGELAINTRDGKLYLKKNVSGVETIVDVTAGGLLPATASVLGGVKGLTNLTIDAAGNLSLSAANVNSALGYTPSDAAKVFPSGTSMIFKQTAAPTGWTKSTALDDAALRVVSGTAGSGGSVGFTAAFASQAVSGTVANTTATGTISSTTDTGTVGATTLTTEQMPSHTHTTVNVRGGYWYGAVTNPLSDDDPYVSGEQTGAAGGSGSHTHGLTMNSHTHTFTGTAHNHTFSGTAINLAVKYADVIIATKD